MTLRNELRVGDRPGLDDEAFEVLRVWVREGGRSHTFVHPSIIEDPEAFGVMLANTVRDCAAGYAAEKGIDGNAVLKRIFEGMYKRLSDTDPTVSGAGDN